MRRQCIPGSRRQNQGKEDHQMPSLRTPAINVASFPSPRVQGAIAIASRRDASQDKFFIIGGFLISSFILFIYQKRLFLSFWPCRPDISRSGSLRRAHAYVRQPTRKEAPHESKRPTRRTHPDPSVDTGHTFTRHRAGSAPIRPKANGSQFMGQQQDAGQSQSLIRNSKIPFLYNMLIER